MPQLDRNIESSYLFLILIPIAAVIFYSSLFRGGRPPALGLPDPNLDQTLAFDALHMEIEIQLETLFKERFGQYYVLPEGLTLSAVGEHIYSRVGTLAGLQEIFVDLLFQREQSPFF